MPKIQKTKKKISKDQKEINIQRYKLKKSMFDSAMLTFLIAALMLIISFLFNGKVLGFWVEKVDTAIEADSNTVFSILDIVLRTLSVILFFFFSLLSIGNLQELRGYVVTWKEMVMLLVLSLIQTTISGAVFALSFLGISLLLIYLYFVQGRTESDSEF